MYLVLCKKWEHHESSEKIGCSIYLDTVWTNNRNPKCEASNAFADTHNGNFYHFFNVIKFTKKVSMSIRSFLIIHFSFWKLLYCQLKLSKNTLHFWLNRWFARSMFQCNFCFSWCPLRNSWICQMKSWKFFIFRVLSYFLDVK